MKCDACTLYAASRHSGQFKASCRVCQVRELALGPLYFQSSKRGSHTPEYQAALKRMFGKDWQEGHTHVKAMKAQHDAPVTQPGLL